MRRRTAIRHSVRGHTRNGAKVQSYMRGSGTSTRRLHGTYHLPKPMKPERHGRKKYKSGEQISYKNSRGKRVSGTVRGVRQEYYIVERKDRLYKVDRHSPFDQIGRALKRGAQLSKKLVVETPGALQKAARVAGAVAGAPERTERRLKRYRAKLKREFEKGKRTGLPRKTKADLVRGKKVHVGPRGGKYVLIDGQQVYL